MVKQITLIAFLILPFSTLQSAVPVKQNATLRSAWKLVGEELTVGANHNLFPNTGYGVLFNDVRGGFLDGSTWVCGSTYDVLNGHGNETGYCTGTDNDGDQIYTTVSSEGPKDGADIIGEYTIKGGTGKYATVKGELASRCTIQPQSHQLICSNVASYSL
jgi:hypothetical protein